ncbi:hypothetical protein [Crocinitomix catalasitica]|uniref:hypothetical protein n=1 Tax=Crocinitomix catalasitica TaxID=184607 RepID=UPI0004828420|nr:hypothetical protein [Crocinitomix catalasitica]
MKKSVFLSALFGILIMSCHTIKWNSLNTTGVLVEAPAEITALFNKYPDQIMVLDANCPGADYKYDIGEKDVYYGYSKHSFSFNKVTLKLHDKMPQGKVIVDIAFIDDDLNKVLVNDVDLLRLAPKFDASGDMIYPEIIEEEFNRFGYTFRKEHDEFSIELANKDSDLLNSIEDRAYRCQIVNNCLAPTKWEFSLTTEDYSDFNKRLKETHNLNQNRILSHSWFYMDKDLYAALIHAKNPDFNADFNMDYSALSDKAEQVAIDFSTLREPIKYRTKTELLELGYKTGRQIEPLDNEQFYKKEYQLLLEGKDQTYTSILETPVKTTQFQDAGFYTELTPKEFDLNWMKHLDSVHLDVVNVKGTDAYIELTLTGQWSPYKINIGNIDLAQLSEQKLFGLLFGINTYPKNRRYNPVQSTISIDADLLPNDIKPYVFLTNKDDDKWVNNQYKGIEKIYLTYESMEKDVLVIYVLSYERITPVWMARVKLTKEMREKVRIRKGLYNY